MSYSSYDLAVAISEPSLDAVVIESKALMVQTQEMQDGGVEIVRGDNVIDGLEAFTNFRNHRREPKKAMSV